MRRIATCSVNDLECEFTVMKGSTPAQFLYVFFAVSDAK